MRCVLLQEAGTKRPFLLRQPIVNASVKYNKALFTNKSDTAKWPIGLTQVALLRRSAGHVTQKWSSNQNQPPATTSNIMDFIAFYFVKKNNLQVENKNSQAIEHPLSGLGAVEGGWTFGAGLIFFSLWALFWAKTFIFLEMTSLVMNRFIGCWCTISFDGLNVM